MRPITEMFVFVAENEDEEGIIAAGFERNGTTMMTPLVCVHLSLAQKMLPVAENISKQSGKRFKILRFSNVEDVTEQVKTCPDCSYTQN